MNARTRSRFVAIAAMIADMRDALQAVLGPISEPVLLPGGASKEAWAVDADGRRLLVRRAAGGVIHRHTLSLKHEFEVLQAAHAAGVKVPQPVLYIEDLDGREAFVMERIEGETIGRRIVRMQVPEHLPLQMAEELAKIHALPSEDLPFLEEASIDRLVEELDEVGEPHPAIELGLWWLRKNRLPAREPVVVHGDFRIGNVAVDANGLVGVLDWEFAHLDDPARDLAFGLVRAWRFGRDDLRLGGIGEVEPYLERYNELTGREIRPEELDYWEVAGNAAWAIGCVTQARRHLTGQERSVELAILGRLGAEVEYEICHLLEAKGVT
jgi:aminoglycoside phosphotransferase (APT) family kinase protein